MPKVKMTRRDLFDNTGVPPSRKIRLIAKQARIVVNVLKCVVPINNQERQDIAHVIKCISNDLAAQ